MKKIICGALLGAMMSLGLAGAAMAGPDEDAIAKLMNQDLAAGWKQNNPGKVLEVYADEVPLVSVQVGKDTKTMTMTKAEKKKAVEEYLSKMKVMDFAMGDIMVTKINDNLGLVSTTEKVTVVAKNGEENQMVVRNIYEVIKQKGMWHVQKEISVLGDAMN